MVTRKPEGALTKFEKRIVKALLNKGWRNQDIQDLINRGRAATINSARITEVKKNNNITPATESDVAYFQYKKSQFDFRTGLNLIDDERLVRSREAMILAVNTFNTPAVSFKAEVFSVLATIAWTYLLHEYLERKKIKIVDDNGNSLLLSQMIKRGDVPISKGIKNNLEAIIEIRNTVEHKLLSVSDERFYPIYQACCLNFDKTLTQMFGEGLSLASDLGLAIQFAKMTTDQLATLQQYPIPEHISSLDARLDAKFTEEERADLEYQFRVVYTLDSATKKTAHFSFVRPESAEGKAIQNVLVKYESADKKYPFKPGQVVKKVHKAANKGFTMNNHTRAMYKYEVRPRKGVAQPNNTDHRYCVYHPAHKDYTYSQDWIDFLVARVSNEDEYAAIKSFKVS